MDNRHAFDITIQFRTDVSDGMLFYAQGPKGVRDFMAIGLKKKRVHLSYDQGDGNVTVVSQRPIRSNRWTNLRVTRHGVRSEMFFGSRRVATGVSPKTKTIANLHTINYVGKADVLLSGKTHPDYATVPFKGCIRHVKIGGVTMPLRGGPKLNIKQSKDISTCAECYSSVQISYLVDSSSHVGSDGFDKSREFVKTIAQYFDTNKMTNKLIMFNDLKSTAKLAIGKSNIKDFIKSLDGIKHATSAKSGTTAVAMSSLTSALSLALEDVNSNTPHTIILITTTQLSEQEAQQKLSQQIDQVAVASPRTRLYLIQVGPTSPDSSSDSIAQLVSNQPGNQLLTVPAYNDVFAHTVKLRETICKVSKKRR